MNTTKPTSIKTIKRNWHIFDAEGQILGRLAAQVAVKLMGKSKPYFVRNLDCGDHVVILNVEKVQVTGKKEKQKMYSNYSGYPGGLKQKPLWLVRAQKPQELLKSAVYGMLPKNKLRDRLITRLYLIIGSQNPYKDKFK